MNAASKRPTDPGRDGLADRLHAWLGGARPILLDGAFGTELERRGIACPAPLWSAAALLSHPQAVLEIHRDYAAAGARILVADTFRTNPRTLARADRSENGAQLSRLAIELARSAARTADPADPAIVAASVAPAEDCYRPDLAPDEPTLRREHRQLAAWLRAAGADLAWIETIGTVREARAACQAAAEAGIPFAVNFILKEDGALLGGDSLTAAVAAVEPSGPIAIGLNCIPPAALTALLPRLRDCTCRPIAAYAHIGNARPLPGWSFAQDLSPAGYADEAQKWRDAGAAILGGCCGTTPAHIAALREALDERAGPTAT